MLATAKYIGAGAACSGLIGAGADFYSITLILNILGFTIILITLETIVLKGENGFIAGINAVVSVVTKIAAGAGSASVCNRRNGRDERKKQKKEVEKRPKEEKAESAKQAKMQTKVDSLKNNLKSSSVILG